MESVLMNTFVSLLAVIGLMMVVLFLYRKFFLGTRKSRQSRVAIDVLGHRMLQPKRSVFILKVMDRMVVVGVTEAGMQPLMELSEPPSAVQDAGLPPAEPAETPFLRPSVESAGAHKKFPQYLQDSIGAVLGELKRTRKSSDRRDNDTGSVIWGTNFTL